MSPTKSIDLIVTHIRPHLDELFAIWLLKTIITKEFGNLANVRVDYVDAGSDPDGGLTADDWELQENGRLYIGVGHGRFDEHPSAGVERKAGATATSLVAKALRVERRFAYRQLISYVTTVDLEGSSDVLGLHQMVQALNAANPRNTNRVYATLVPIFEAITKRNRDWNKADRELKSTSTMVTPFGSIRIPEESEEIPLKLVAATTDNERFVGRAISKLGGRNAVVVQMNATGRIQIFVNRIFNLELSAVITAIAVAEHLALTGEPLERPVPAVEGPVAGAENWFYFPQTGMLANGTLTSPNAPRTLLSLDAVSRIVLDNIGIPATPVPATPSPDTASI